MHAGIARRTVTPPAGLPMDGFIGRGPAEDTHDRLLLTVLHLRGADGPGIAFVSVDVLSLSAATVADVRDRIAAIMPDPPLVLLACSHTHYGPAADPDAMLSVAVPNERSGAYIEALRDAVASAVQESVATATPARLSMGSSEAAIGVNRRERAEDGSIILGVNPDGPVDRRVDVLRVDGEDGRPLAVLFNHACHGVSLGPDCRQWSADFVGPARDRVEARVGAPALFMQGAAGDINPQHFGLDWAHPVELGELLARGVLAGYERATPLDPASAMRSRSVLVRLPRLRPATVVDARADIVARRRDIEVYDGAADDPELMWRRVRLEQAEEALAMVEGTAPDDVEIEIDAVALDDRTAIITAPAEVFTEIASEIRARSPFPRLFYSGYTNGNIYYLPTRAAYQEGGYEVSYACLVGPDSAHLVIEESVALLEALHHAQGI